MTKIPITPPEYNFGGYSTRFPERYFYLMVYLLMTAGLRRREVLELKPESIDLSRRLMTITSRKSQTTRQITIPPDLHGLLSAYFQEQVRVREAAMTRLERVRRFFILRKRNEL